MPSPVTPLKHVYIYVIIVYVILVPIQGIFAINNMYKLNQRILAPIIYQGPELRKTIIENHHCADVISTCTHMTHTGNLYILECLRTFTPKQLEDISDNCQHTIWLETQLMLNVTWIKEALFLKECANEHDVLELCLSQVNFWQCIKRTSDTFDHNNKCRILIKRMYSVLFPDYDQLENFLNSCISDVQKFECGRLNVNRKSISQIETVQCLLDVGGDVLQPNCKLTISNLKEQYADLLFFETCLRDLQHLCPQELSGTPSAFKCLVRFKNHPSITLPCKDKITKRDQEIAKDYTISRSLSKACKDDIKLYNCRKSALKHEKVRLVDILLCLESVKKNGTQISADCLLEIDDHRHMLMQDSQLSPEVLSNCAEDMKKFCSSNINYDNDVIHCLMDHAHVKRYKDNYITAQCQRSLEKLIKVTDVGEDWRVDPILRRTCKPVVDRACRDTEGGEARVISCLIEQIDSNVMTLDCSRALLLIQYFVARDFNLNPQLYKHCRNDAIKYCHAKREWDDAQIDPERGPLVLSCLHRIAYSDDEQYNLRTDCFKQVKQVMRQRAISVDLIPEVEDVCINDLSKMCYDRTERGAEMECLQNNLEQLEPSCKNAVSIYTEEEAAHVELNPVVMSVCFDAMKTYCANILLGDEKKDSMMECLISHKNDAEMRQNQKCRAAIEHFQIISLKNYHFTYKFKEACRPYVSRFCSGSTTKNDVVACLSEIIRNDTIRSQRHSIPKECRQQVKSQLYQQRESLLLDPKLANACKTEIQDICKDKKSPGEALECLIINTPRLGNTCHHAVFLIKKSELSDSATDYVLLTVCKQMIHRFCQQYDQAHLLDCLKLVKDETNFDQRCHLVVVNRMIEQNTDFRFNPNLQLYCGKNIANYCSDIVAKAQPNEELNGKVIQCLKEKFRKNLLDMECSQQIIKILQEQAFNYKFNPLLRTLCKHEIKVLCNPERFTQENGLVEECLKTAFLQQKIINRDCRVEVATLIMEAKADIHVDPILEEACTVDLLRYCSNVKTGNGRKLKCLQTVHQDQSKAMEKDCRLKLQQRIEMFKNADTALMEPPENMGQLVQQVVTSPAKRFFIVILMTSVGMIFIMGIFFGRFTKRAINTKNK